MVEIIETSRRISESQAMMAAVDMRCAEELVHFPNFVATKMQDCAIGAKDYSVYGYIETGSMKCSVSILVTFPGFIERSMARVRDREPMATVNLGIYALDEVI